MQIVIISKKKLLRFFALIIFLLLLILTGYKYINNRQHTPAFTYSDNRFVDQTIVIDAGHGGIDSGVVHSSGLMEKDINLQIGKYLKELLEESGANTVITRDKDVELSPLSNVEGTRHKRDLNARVNIIDNNEADLFISIHVNSFPQDTSVKGPIVFYHHQSETSKKLAEVLQNRLNIEYNKKYKDENKDNHPKGDSYYILQNTKSPGVIVETGFMSNDEDYKLLKEDQFQYFVAYQLYIGLGEYLEE